MSALLATGLSTAVQNKIEDLVLQGKLQGGDKLNEVELAELFGTSRGPIREACKGLGSGRVADGGAPTGAFSYGKWTSVRLWKFMISERFSIN